MIQGDIYVQEDGRRVIKDGCFTLTGYSIWTPLWKHRQGVKLILEVCTGMQGTVPGPAILGYYALTVHLILVTGKY